MTPDHVTVGDLREGMPVEYLGDEPDRLGVIGDELVARGMALFPGHPGRVWRTTPQHVQVSWTGLEDEPESYAVGFSTPGSLQNTAQYTGLGRLSEDEFIRREKAMEERLSGAQDLSGWTPPWRSPTW